MTRLLLLAVLALALASPFSACDSDGPNCCALKSFCSICTTCTNDDKAVASRNDEVACKTAVDRLKSGGQFCNPEDAPPQRMISEDLMMCGE